MTQFVDSIICARWMIPVEPEQVQLENHALAIRDGKIIDIATKDVLLQRWQSNTVHELDDHLLIPGLVNAHTHAAMNLMKGVANDLPLMTWLHDHIWPIEGRFISDEFVYQGTRLAMAEMLKSGTTCFNDMYFMPDMAAKAAIESGLRANIGLIVIDFPTAWAKDADDYLHKGLQVFDRFKHHSQLSFSFAPHAPYTVSDEPLLRIGTLAEELQLTIHMHLHETALEVEQALQQTGQRPIARLHQLGLLSPAFQAVHMTQLNDSDLTLVSDCGIHVIHCPESNMKLASGMSPIKTLQQTGVNIALGTDSSASNNDLNMLGEMRSAAFLAKVASGDPSAFNAFDVLKAATLGGAKALGLDAVCGSLEINKSADLCAINLNDIATQPVFDPLSQLIFAASRDQVSHVWTQGKLQLADGQLQHLDEQECIDIAKFWQKKIREQK